MSLTVRQVISQIKTPNKFVNADSRVTNKYIYSLLRKHRDVLIKQLDSKFQLMKLGYLYQIWKCVDLIPTPTVDECCGIKSNCTIYRTRKKLPYTLVASWGPIIRTVSSLDGFTEFIPITPTEWNRIQQDANSKWDKAVYYFWSEGYLYFPNIEWKKVQVEAFFEEDIDRYNECCDEVDHCKSFLDNKFRIPKEVLAICVENVNKEIMGEYDRIQPDDNKINKDNNKK